MCCRPGAIDPRRSGTGGVHAGAEVGRVRRSVRFCGVAQVMVSDDAELYRNLSGKMSTWLCGGRDNPRQ